jgi:hypothetical protein
LGEHGTRVFFLGRKNGRFGASEAEIRTCVDAMLVEDVRSGTG